MKKTVTSLVSLGFVAVLVIGFINCGGTGGQGPGTGAQTINQSCANDGCVELSSPSRLTVGEEDGFSVTLTNADASPAADIQICCVCPEGGCGVSNPSGGCGFTDSSGFMSGRLGCAAEGSHRFECNAPSGFAQTAANTVVCEADVCTPPTDPTDPADRGTGCGSNQFCADAGGACSFPENTCVALRREGECCEATSQCIGAPDTTCRGGTCTTTCAGAGGTCAEDADCCSNNCNETTAECIGG